MRDVDSASASNLRPVPVLPKNGALLRLRRDAVAGAGVYLTLTAVAVQSVLYALNVAFSADIQAIDVNAEHTLFAWLASVEIFAAALACMLLAVSGLARKGFLLTLAGLIAFLSLDEAVAIHERIGLRVVALLDVSPSWDSVIWPILYVPLLLTVLILLVLESRRGPQLTSVLVLAGLGCLAAAVGAEVISFPFSTGEGGISHAIEGAAEEALELGGWGLIATGLLSWFAEPGQRLVSRA
jgi:hypothetical protein